MTHDQYVPTIIIDRNALFRIGLTHTLAQTRFCVAAEYSSVNEINISSLPSNIFLFLIGIDDYIKEYIDFFHQIRDSIKDFRVIILGDRTDKKEIDAAMRLRGDCYMLKTAITPDTLLRSLEIIMAGQTVFTQDFIRILRDERSLSEPTAATSLNLNTRWEIQHVISQIGDTPAAWRLSERETAILKRLMHGAANKVIARELDIAEATVKVHVKSVLRKIRVKNRTQAATWAWAHCSGESTPPEPALVEMGASTGPALSPVNGVTTVTSNERSAPSGLSIGLV